MPATVSLPMTAGRLRALPTAATLGALGVVYGDIGTSPLYALREAVKAAAGSDGIISEPHVLGVLSLILWSLILIVTCKYVLILLRADNNGEGGTLAPPCRTRMLSVESMPKSVVVVALATLFV